MPKYLRKFGQKQTILYKSKKLNASTGSYRDDFPNAITDFKIEDYPEALQFMGKEYANGYVRQLGTICERLGISVSVLNPEEQVVDGVIRRTHDDKWSIEVDDSDSQVQRYLMAHELGHYFSFKRGSYSKAPLRSDTESSELNDTLIVNTRESAIEVGKHKKFPKMLTTLEERAREAEANFIGLYLLMPDKAMQELFDKGATVSNMVYEFNVPSSLVLRRISLFATENTDGVPLEAL